MAGKLGELTRIAGRIRSGLTFARAASRAVTSKGSGKGKNADIKDFLSEFKRSQTVLKSDDVQEGIRNSLEKQGKTFNEIEDHIAKLTAQESTADKLGELAMSGKSLDPAQIEEMFSAFKGISESLKLVEDSTKINLKTETQFKDLAKTLQDSNITDTARMRAFEDSKQLFEMIALQSKENGSQDSKFAKDNASISMQIGRANISSAEGIRQVITLLEDAGALSKKEKNEVATTFGEMNEKLGSLVVNSDEIQGQLLTASVMQTMRGKVFDDLEKRITDPSATKNLGELLFGESFNELDDFLGISEKVSALKKGAIQKLREKRRGRLEAKGARRPRKVGTLRRAGGFLKSPTGLAIAGGALSIGLLVAAIQKGILDIGPMIGEAIRDLNPLTQSRRQSDIARVAEMTRTASAQRVSRGSLKESDVALLNKAETESTSGGIKGLFGLGASEEAASKTRFKAELELLKLRKGKGLDFELPKKLQDKSAAGLLEELQKLNQTIAKQAAMTTKNNQALITAIQDSSSKGAIVIQED